MQCGCRPRVGDRRLVLDEDARKLRSPRRRGILGGELGGGGLDRPLRIHHLAHADAGEAQLYRQRFGEQRRVAAGDARPATGADLDLDHAQCLQRAQRIARDDATGSGLLGDVLLGAEPIARRKAPGEQRGADFLDDARRQRRRRARRLECPRIVRLAEGNHGHRIISLAGPLSADAKDDKDDYLSFGA